MTVVSLGEICKFVYGKALADAKRVDGPVPVYGSNGVVGSHNATLTSSETIIIGRKGSVGQLCYSAVPCWPIDTTYFIDRTATSEHIRWLFHALHALRLPELSKATGVPGLKRSDAYERKIYRPVPEEQKRIASILDMANSIRRKREETLVAVDEFLRAAFLQKFGDPLKNPFGFRRQKIEEHLSNVRVGTQSGPFGSSLKKHEYIDSGIPVWGVDNVSNK